MYMPTDPYTKYKFWVKSFTWKHEGLPSHPPISAVTDVSAPSAPAILNLTCGGGGGVGAVGYSSSLLVSWSPPRVVHHSVDVYEVEYVALTLDGGGRVKSRRTVTVDGKSRAFRERKVRSIRGQGEVGKGVPNYIVRDSFSYKFTDLSIKIQNCSNTPKSEILAF